MDIIRPGKVRPKEPTVYRGECKACGCIFECSEEDLVGSGAAMVKCPTEGCDYSVMVVEKLTRHPFIGSL